MTSDRFSRPLLVIAGLLGAGGVSAAAAARHADEARILGALALIALSHAPVLVALALASGSLFLRAAGLVIAFGALLFCADLLARHFLGDRLFPMSAPLGGLAMITGWLLLALAGLFAPRA